MKSNKREPNKAPQNKNEKSKDPLKDGIRYDYTDSSDFKNDKMS